MKTDYTCGIQRRLEQYVQSSFYRLGHFIGRHPWPHLLLPLVLTALLSVGMLRFREVNDVREYMPLTAPARHEYRVVEEFHSAYGRLRRLMVLVRSADKGSLLRAEQSKSLLELLDHLQRGITIGGNRTFADLCASYCESNLPLEAFLKANSQRDSLLGWFVQLELTYPIAKLMGHEVYVASHLYDLTLRENSSLVDSVKLVKLAFYAPEQDDNATTTALLLEWETKVYRLLQVGFPGFTKESRYPLLQTLVGSENFVSLEIRRVGMETVPYLAMGLGLIVVFTVVTAFRCNVHHSLPLEALVGAVAPLLAVLASVGIVLGCGLRWQPIVILTLILAVAVGVDDVYLILHAWNDVERSLPTPHRIALTLQTAGPSITMTSATNTLAFFVGIFSGTPAVAAFCTYSCVAMLAGYVFQICLCSAILTFRGRMEAAGRHYFECFCRITKTTDPSKEDGCQAQLPGVLLRKFVKFLTSNCGRFLVLLSLLAYWAVSVYGFLSIEVDLNPKKLVNADSSVVPYFDQYEQYVMTGVQQRIVIVNRPGDLRPESNRHRIERMVGEFESTEHSYGSNSTVWWYKVYRANISSAGELGFTYRRLPAWLDDSHFRTHLRIEPAACMRNDPRCVSAFMLLVSCQAVRNNNVRSQSLAEWRAIAHRYTDFNVSIFDEDSFMADILSSIEGTTVATVSAASICVGAVCLLLMGNLLSVLAAAAAVLSINLGVFGGLTLWSVDLDPFMMCSLLMAIGFSVDFTAHVSYHYFSGNAQQSGEERLQRTLTTVGWPTLQAAASTVLGVWALALCDAYINAVIVKTVTLVVLLGLYHGMIVLPAFLTLFHRKTTTENGGRMMTEVDAAVDEATPALAGQIGGQLELVEKGDP